jgi:hypothetical protein
MSTKMLPESAGRETAPPAWTVHRQGRYGHGAIYYAIGCSSLSSPNMCILQFAVRIDTEIREAKVIWPCSLTHHDRDRIHATAGSSRKASRRPPPIETNEVA